MSFTIQGVTIVESAQPGSTQSFNNYATEAGLTGLFSDAASISDKSPGWNDVQVGWYVWGAGVNNSVVTAIDNAAGTVTVDSGAFVPGAVYLFKADAYPTLDSL
jgi:hypothetical protein